MAPPAPHLQLPPVPRGSSDRQGAGEVPGSTGVHDLSVAVGKGGTHALAPGFPEAGTCKSSLAGWMLTLPGTDSSSKLIMHKWESSAAPAAEDMFEQCDIEPLEKLLWK